MIDYVVYGKIIIDDIRLTDGTIVRGVLGGGGPQGALGARLWSPSVGLSTRSGTDMEPGPIEMLEGIGVDLQGWVKFPDIPTPHAVMEYDDQQYIHRKMPIRVAMNNVRNMVARIVSQPISLPEDYQHPRVIHLITEYTQEPMSKDALELRQKGAIYSLEPIIDFRNWKNKDEMLAFMPQVDIASPDWPSASGIAGSDDPLQVMKFWAKLGLKAVSVRDGRRGSYVWDCDHDQCWRIPPVPVNVVDPTGAGNCYGGGFCVGWDQTHDALQAGCYGAISAHFLVERVGLPALTTELVARARALLEPALESAKKM